MIDVHFVIYIHDRWYRLRRFDMDKCSCHDERVDVSTSSFTTVEPRLLAGGYRHFGAIGIAREVFPGRMITLREVICSQCLTIWPVIQSANPSPEDSHTKSSLKEGVMRPSTP